MGLITHPLLMRLIEPKPSLVQRLLGTQSNSALQEQLTRANQQLAQAQSDNQELQQAVS